MDSIRPGFPVHHQVPEQFQTHVHWVSDAIQPSHPLFFLPLIFPSISVFSSLQQAAKFWGFSFSISPSNEYSGLISFRIDWFDSLEVQGTLKSSSTLQFKNINSLALSFLYGPTLTSTHDYWNMLSRLIIAFILRSKHLLISWLQSQSAVILESKKIQPVNIYIVSPSICHKVMG